jgi:ABC-2 type transport system permease protein
MSSKTVAAAQMGLREQRRRPIFLVLLVALPVWFIARATAVTEPIPKRVGLPGGVELLTNMRDIHAVQMAVIAVGFLAALCGVFLMLSAREADRRLVVAGYTPAEAIAARALVLAVAVTAVVVVSLAVTMRNFELVRWPVFAGALVVVGILYGALGALAGALLDRVVAVYVVFFFAMVDLGIAQNPMFGDGEPSGWVTVLPGWAPGRIAIDAAFSERFRAGSELAVAIGLSGALFVTVAWVLRRSFSAGT